MSKWLSNTHDPNGPHADMLVSKGFNETQEEAAQHWREWLRGKEIGRPKETHAYTVEELERRGMVGVYEP